MARTAGQLRRRAGFTLVELLIVIIVIGVLIALLVPAVIASIRTANNAATIADITSFANSLNAFKDAKGSYPPSRVMLNEKVDFGAYSSVASSYLGSAAANFWASGTPVAADTNGNDLTTAQLAQRSALYMRKFFPRARTAVGTNWNDFNGNGTADAGWYYLEGQEALVFFLGGVASQTTSPNGTPTYSMQGFGRDPAAPFTFPGDSNNAVASIASMVSLNRTPPYFEFNNARLADADGDTFLDYADYLSTPSNPDERRPYVYFSGYDGQGYDPNDANLLETSRNGVSPLLRAFRVNLGLSPLAGRGGDFTSLPPGVISSPSPNPYTSGAPVPDTSGVKPPAYINPNSFQVLSPGLDRTYGIGGQYASQGNTRLTVDSYISPSDTALRSSLEGDNLSNFNGSKLE